MRVAGILYLEYFSCSYLSNSLNYTTDRFIYSYAAFVNVEVHFRALNSEVEHSDKN